MVPGHLPLREAHPVRIGHETYRVFEAHGLMTPEVIARAGWARLVELLGKGGHRRYDESTATRLLAIADHLLKEYDGMLNRLYQESKDDADLDRCIRATGKGIGQVTIDIFLRDMQTVWPRADPPLAPDVYKAATDRGITDLNKYTSWHHIDEVCLETALHRLSGVIGG